MIDFTKRIPSPPLRFFVNEIIHRRSLEAVDVEHVAIVYNFEYKFPSVVDFNMELEKMFGVAMMSVDHEV